MMPRVSPSPVTNVTYLRSSTVTPTSQRQHHPHIRPSTLANVQHPSSKPLNSTHSGTTTPHQKQRHHQAGKKKDHFQNYNNINDNNNISIPSTAPLNQCTLPLPVNAASCHQPPPPPAKDHPQTNTRRCQDPERQIGAGRYVLLISSNLLNIESVIHTYIVAQHDHKRSRTRPTTNRARRTTYGCAEHTENGKEYQVGVDGQRTMVDGSDTVNERWRRRHVS